VIEQAGVVAEVRAGEARVQAAGSAGGCSACSASGGCGTAALARFFGRRDRSLWARNDAGATVGDRVVIGLEERALQSAALTAYAWPLLGLLAGSIIGDLAATPGTGELAGIVTGLTGLFAGIVVARHRAGSAAARQRTQARVIRVLPASPASPMPVRAMHGGTS